MPKKITKWSEVLGNQDKKDLILDAISRDVLPHFILFTGNYGIGKSTFANLTAKSILCKNPDPLTHEPCGVCECCLSVDNHEDTKFRVINMPALSKNTEVAENIQEIFKIQKVSDRTVYLWEELQDLQKPFQKSLVEELTKIPNDVWILSCTTKTYDIIPAILNRALEIPLAPLSHKDCVTYVRRLSDEYGLKIESPKAITSLIEQCNANPRKLSEVIRFVATENNLTEASLAKMFDMVDSLNLVKFINAMFDCSDMFVFIKTIQELQDVSNLALIQRKTLDYLYQYILAIAGGGDLGKANLPSPVKEAFTSIFSLRGKTELVALAYTLGEVQLKEQEPATSQKSKLLLAKSNLDRVTAKTGASTLTPRKEPALPIIPIKQPIQPFSLIKDTDQLTSKEFIDNAMIKSPVGIDALLLDGDMDDD